MKEAQRLGMLVWLYDEDTWPSGTASGRVVEEHPEYRMSQVYPAHEFIVIGPTKLSKEISVNDEIIFIQAMSWDKKKGYTTVRIKELNKFIEKLLGERRITKEELKEYMPKKKEAEIKIFGIHEK